MVYKLVNGHFSEVMKELYTANDEIHNHFTRLYIFLILIKDVPMFTQDAMVL